MFKSILRQLYNGELYPAENSVPKTNDYLEAVDKISKSNNQLRSTFDDKQNLVYEEMVTAYYIKTDLEQTELFSEGFKLGAKLMLEVLQNDTNLVQTAALTNILKEMEEGK